MKCLTHVGRGAVSRIGAAALICASHSFALPATVPVSVTQAMTVQHVPPAALSFVILDPETGRVVASHNPDTLRSPASTIKTVTTFAALDMLGPTYSWQTKAL